MKIANRPSAPTWADLATTDLPGAKAFYQGLFGWTGDDVPMEEAGGYGMFLTGGKYVGGYGPCMAPGQPVSWTCYFQVADADETAAKVAAHGGTVIAAPMDVFASGRLAVFADPEGAVFGVWQPREHEGFGVIDQPGSVCWFELMSREPEKAKAFYTAVFGWGALGSQHAGPATYTEWQLEGQAFSGMMPMTEDFPSEIPARWMVCFAVEDCDRAATRVTELGGTVTVEPTTIPPGRFTVVSDPQGGYFSLITLAAQP
uniref:VOC family protein n=1 Tax=Streptomyces sp. NBC_00003 TaxID=2903608 RepID=A0AAU2VE08_9ACTN